MKLNVWSIIKYHFVINAVTAMYLVSTIDPYYGILVSLILLASVIFSIIMIVLAFKMYTWVITFTEALLLLMIILIIIGLFSGHDFIYQLPFTELIHSVFVVGYFLITLTEPLVQGALYFVQHSYFGIRFFAVWGLTFLYPLTFLLLLHRAKKARNEVGTLISNVAYV